MDLEVHYRGFVIEPVKTSDIWNGVIRRLNGEEFNADGMAKTSIETMNCLDIQTAVGTAKLAVDGIMRRAASECPGVVRADTNGKAGVTGDLKIPPRKRRQEHEATSPTYSHP